MRIPVASPDLALVEATPGELFDGNIGKLGRVVHDLPFDGNGV